MKRISLYFVTLGVLIPQVAHAQVCSLSTITSFINCITDIISGSIIRLLVALAVVFFLWGAAKFLRNAEDPGKREEGRMFMLYGVIALFVIVAVWGLVGILANTFGIDVRQPQFPGGGGKSGYWSDVL
ncbi:MAG: pilin [Patescibacteria group bacterium]